MKLPRSTLIVVGLAVPACMGDGGDDQLGTVDQAVAAGGVVVNEFTAGSAGKIELWNGGAATADVSGWSVDDVAGGGSAPKLLPAGTTIAPGGWLQVTYAGINTASTDQVRVIDATGVEVDAHTNFYAGSAITGLCFGRQPDGDAWATAAIACTLGATNGGGSPPPPPPPPAVVTINEHTAGASGWVELHNASPTVAAVGGWQVDDDAGGGAAKTIAAGTTIPANGWLVVTLGSINVSSADSARLLDATGAVIDSHASGYAGSSITGLCFGRRPDGGAWATGAIPCTRGATNGLVCAAGTACDDGDGCTTGETWSATCACTGGGPLPCDDLDACTADACATSACVHTPIACDDADPCTIDSCDAALGCAHAAAADGTSCGTDLACQAGACVPVPPAGCSGDPDPTAATIAAQGTDGILLRGTLVYTWGYFEGELLVQGSTITCAAASCAGIAANPTVIETHGIILPGMIDAHNHILFDIFDTDDWSPTKVYANHNQWPNDARYGAMVDAKQYLNGEAGSPVSVGCEMDKYGELKGLIAGTTSIQGSANPANKACYGSLARTIDQGPNDLGEDLIQAATIFPSAAAANGVCTNVMSGATDAYVIHVGEGVDQTSLDEFYRLGTITTAAPACLYNPATTIVHGTALGFFEMGEMAADGMSLVWSPRSNIFLYGGGWDLTATTDIPLAQFWGLNVALAPDWSIGGSANLLDELRFADLVDDFGFGDVLSRADLFAMVTINAARALAIDDVLGSLTPGKLADITVIGGDPNAPYDALLAAHPADVRLVMVGGVPLYGDTALEAAAPAAPGCDHLDLCCTSKFVCVAEAGGTATNKLGQTYAQIVDTLTTELTAYDAQDLTAWDFAPITPLFVCE